MTTESIHEAASAAILTHLERGTLLREEWGDGRERACLLSAMAPECADAGNAGRCPSELIPPWLSVITPWIDDDVSDGAWHGIVTRYAGLIRRSGILDDSAWNRIETAARLAAAKEYRKNGGHNEALISDERRPIPSLIRFALLGARAAVLVSAGWSSGRIERAAAAAADRIASAILDAWESEIVAAKESQ